MSKSTSGGTVKAELTIGRPDSTTKTLTASITGTNDPGLRYNSLSSTWQYSNDGLIWSDIGSGGSGDVIRTEYCAVAGNMEALDGYYAQIGGTYIDPSIYDANYVFKFQVILEAPSGGSAYIQLYNQDDGYEIPDSELSTAEIIPTFLEATLFPGFSDYFNNSGTTYTVRAYTTLDGYAAICKMARIEVRKMIAV